MRSTRHVALTEIGQLYADRVSGILGELDQADATVRDRSDDVSGLLRVHAPATFGRTHLMPLVMSFIRQHPGVRMDLTYHDVMPSALPEQADVTIQAGIPVQKELIIRRLISNSRVLVASASYLKRRGTPARPQELRQHSCLVLTQFAPHDIWLLQRGDQVLSIPVRGDLKANNGEMLYLAALEGLGIGLLSTFLVDAALKDGRLLQLMPQWQYPASDIYAVMPPQRHLSRKVRSFVSHIARGLERGAAMLSD